MSKNDLAMEILASWERKMPPGVLPKDVFRSALAQAIVLGLLKENPEILSIVDKTTIRRGIGLVHAREGVSGGGEHADSAPETTPEDAPRTLFQTGEG